MRAILALGRGSEQRLRQSRTILESRRQGDAADCSVSLVFFPSRAGKITTRHALHWKHRGFSHQHRPSFKLVCIRLQLGRELADVSTDQMVGHNICKQFKPEQRYLRKNLALARNPRAKHMIER